MNIHFPLQFKIIHVYTSPTKGTKQPSKNSSLRIQISSCPPKPHQGASLEASKLFLKMHPCIHNKGLAGISLRIQNHSYPPKPNQGDPSTFKAACVRKKSSELEGSCLLATSCEYKGGFLKIALELVGPPWFFPGFLAELACGECLCVEELGWKAITFQFRVILFSHKQL